MNRIEAPLLINQAEGPDSAVIVFEIPALARRPEPGQFFMVRLLTPGYPMFGRALAVLDYQEQSGAAKLSFLVKEVGRGTAMLRASHPEDRAILVGPLGNHFPALDPNRPTLFVAGGTGVAAFHYLIASMKASSKKIPDNLHLLYGARDRACLYLHDALSALPVPLSVSTDDGSHGKAGFVTDLLTDKLNEVPGLKDAKAYVCGPDPMMLAVSKICLDRGLDTYLSLETRMACGTGVCNGCAIEVGRNNEDTVFRRVCHDGPVFPLSALPSFQS